MKKLLIGVLILLLTIMVFLAVLKGISVGSFNILSVEQIANANDNLTNEILQTELLMYNTFKSKTDELNNSVTSLLNAKQEYLDLVNISSEKEISKASQEETYTVEFLWTRLGRHSTAEGVALKYEIASGTTGEANVKNILFTVTGEYIPVINFITAIEDDSELAFRIENFKMVPSGSNVQATFVTKNVRIKLENITSNIQDTTNTTNTVNNQKTENTTTEPNENDIENTNNTNNTVNTTNDTVNDVLSNY